MEVDPMIAEVLKKAEERNPHSLEVAVIRGALLVPELIRVLKSDPATAEVKRFPMVIGLMYLAGSLVTKDQATELLKIVLANIDEAKKTMTVGAVPCDFEPEKLVDANCDCAACRALNKEKIARGN